MRRMVLMLMSAIVATAACNDSTGPHARVTRAIYNIQVPATAAPADSIRLSFDYDNGGCDSALVVDVRPSGTETRFAVSSVPTDRNCPYGLPVALIRIPVVYVVAPPHALPYTLKFAEPGEADSVRIVAAR